MGSFEREHVRVTCFHGLIFFSVVIHDCALGFFDVEHLSSLSPQNQEGVHLAGTFRYHPRPYPPMGEGLALEAASMAPSRNSIRLLAEREETMRSGGAGLGVSPPPVPASMAKTQDSSELDVDMMDDVTLLASMLRGNFLDVQADAATAVAGLTADRELTIYPYCTDLCLRVGTMYFVLPVLVCIRIEYFAHISSRVLSVSCVFLSQRHFWSNCPGQEPPRLRTSYAPRPPASSWIPNTHPLEGRPPSWWQTSLRLPSSAPLSWNPTTRQHQDTPGCGVACSSRSWCCQWVSTLVLPTRKKRRSA